MTGAQLNRFARQSNHALNKRFRMVQRIPENHYVAALDRREPVHKLVDENALLIAQQRRHAGAFHFYRLVQENYNYQREAQRDSQIASPTPQLTPQLRNARIVAWSRRGRVGCIEHSSPDYL